MLPFKYEVHYTDNFQVTTDLTSQFSNQNTMLIVLFYVFLV